MSNEKTSAAPSTDREQVGVIPLDLAKTFKQWVRDHEAELNSREYSRIDRALDQFIMDLALRDASPSRECGERQGVLSIDRVWEIARQHAGAYFSGLLFQDRAAFDEFARSVIAASAPTLGEEVKPTATLITFDEFVQYGREHDANVVNGMPGSFSFYGKAVTHENDDLYLIEPDIRFARGEWLIITAFGNYRMLQVIRLPAAPAVAQPLTAQDVRLLTMRYANRYT